MTFNALAFSFRLWFLLTLFLGELMFVFRLPRRDYFPLRLTLYICLILLFYLICPDVENRPPLSAIVFVGTLILSVLLLHGCWEGDWMSCIFRALAGYNAQHIGSMLYAFLTIFLPRPSLVFWSVPHVVVSLGFSLLTYWVLYIVFGRTIAACPSVTVQQPQLFALTGAMILIEIVISDFIRVESMTHYNAVYQLSASLIDLICTIALMTIQFFLLRQYNLRQEMDMISQMLIKESQQYELSKETVDMINLKCHDIRHQIRAIGSESRIDPDAIREMEQTINIYDAMIHTGNRALDTIFAEKSLLCQKNDISIQCIADGAALSFMSASDIYSLFGNLLDNAIQSVRNLPDNERFIWLTVKEEAGFLSINSHNYFSGQIRMEGDLPATSHEDTIHHGYGTRSIRVIAEKYRGTVSFRAEDSIFNVNILIPRTE